VAAGAGEQEIDQMTDGDYFGELAMFRGGTRTATVRTSEPTEFYSLTHRRLGPLLEQTPAIREGIEAALQARWATHLRAVPLFAGLPPATQEAVAARLRWERRAAGEAIVCQGDPATTLYIIQQGAAEILVTTANGDAPRGTLGAGDYVGAGDHHPATVRATQQTDLYCLDRPVLDALIAAAPELRERLVPVLGPGAP
jgi:CRP-like cAMP-binding protein